MTVLSALLTPTLAAFAGFIAYQQWRTAKDKLKLDLFERRVKVYEAARDFLGSIMGSGKVSQDEEYKYLVGTRGSAWLFDKSIVAYLEKDIWLKTAELHALHEELVGEQGDARTKNIQRQREIKTWLADQQTKVMEKRFAPYLKLRH